jgi:hypothetical protein
MPFPRIMSEPKEAAPEYDQPSNIKILVANDRCDGPNCGSQARGVIILSSGSELLFCRHHTESYKADLLSKGASVYEQYRGL